MGQVTVAPDQVSVYLAVPAAGTGGQRPSGGQVVAALARALREVRASYPALGEAPLRDIGLTRSPAGLRATFYFQR